MLRDSEGSLVDMNSEVRDGHWRFDDGPSARGEVIHVEISLFSFSEKQDEPTHKHPHLFPLVVVVALAPFGVGGWFCSLAQFVVGVGCR